MRNNKRELIKKLKSLAPFIYDVVGTQDMGCEFAAISKKGIIRRQIGMLLYTSSKGDLPEFYYDDEISDKAYNLELENFFSELEIIPFDNLSLKALNTILNNIEGNDDEVKDGPYETFFDNGKLWQKGCLLDGRQYGHYEDYHSNGQLNRKYFYKKGGLRHGSYKDFYANGKLERQGQYKNGNIDGIEEYYVIGFVLGELTHYKFHRINHKDGILEGICEYYFPNGQIKEKGNFKNGKRDGIFEYYNEDGSLKKREIWRNDDLKE